MDAANSIEYLRSHAKVLREGQAPHQQPLAHAIEAVLEAVSADAVTSYAQRNAGLSNELTDALAKIGILETNTAGLITERDEARELNANLTRQMDVRCTDLQEQLRLSKATVALRDERICALETDLAGKNGTGIATTSGETLADIKAGLGAAKTVATGEPTA